MPRLPSGAEALGSAPAHPLLAPVLRPALALDRQRALLDLQAIQRIPGLVGYWPSSAEYLYEDSAGYTPASVSGVVGQVRDISNATTPVARRNLLTYSEEFDNAYWGKISISSFGSGSTADANISPDGSQTADLILPTGTVASSGVYKLSIPVISGGVYTYSVYAKSAGYNAVLVAGHGGDTTGWAVTFNLDTKAKIYSGVNVSGFSVIDAGGGWLRVSVTVTANSTTGAMRIYCGPATSANPTGSFDPFVSNGTSGIYIWGAQLELGASATPYQKIVTGTGDVFLPGNHAYQQTTANKPYLRKTPTSNVHWLDSNTATSALTATLGNLGAACTVCRATAEGVTFTEGVTISSTYNIAPAYGFNGDVAIFNRALSVTEKALLTRYMQRGVPVLGANRITNGTFNTDTTGWVAVNAALSVESGKLRVTNTGAVYGFASQSVATTSGKAFVLGGDPYNGTNSSAAVKVANTPGGTAYVSVTVPGTNKIFVATANTIYPQCISTNVSNGYADYDNISLQEIL